MAELFGSLPFDSFVSATECHTNSCISHDNDVGEAGKCSNVVCQFSCWHKKITITIIFGQLASAAMLFAKFYAGTRKSLSQ